MKLTCTQENLNKGLGLCSRIISSPKTLPILSNVLIATDKGRLKLSVTNLEVGINVWIRAKIDKQGAITVPARILSDFVNNNRDSNIQLETSDLSLSVKSDNCQAKISGIESGEFPVIPTIKEDQGFELSAKELEEAIPKIIIACATDESRPVLSGVLFNCIENKLKLVTTDSYRLAEQTLGLANKLDLPKVIVPNKTMQEVYRIIGSHLSSKDKVQINVAENQILFKFGNDIEVSSRLIEGVFPSYEQIVPATPSTTVSTNKKQFLSAVKSGSLFSQNTANNIRIKTEKNNLIILAQSNQIGDSKIQVKSEIHGGDIEIAFNARFIIDALNNLSGESVELGLTEKLAPAKITNPKDKNYTYVIMPLRTEE
ncbi:DNA polymerase III subunit beta [Patescibacteria group bacterium]